MQQTETAVYFILTVPEIVLFYLVVLFFMRPSKAVLIASLAGGLVMALLNIAFDLIAYYAHIWHYFVTGLFLHLALPIYITPLLIFGSLAYLLIWKFWEGRTHWVSLLVLFGVPTFGILRDIFTVLVAHSSYNQWDSPLAIPYLIVMWAVMFYAGYFVFRRMAPSFQQKPVMD
ncbi:MAG TPA: hypothetical protein VFN23_05430 [Ktedonobacteraceae bacterium]|nr:hypothetical protein [Ktedonobacteraceae bacterium]